MSRARTTFLAGLAILTMLSACAPPNLPVSSSRGANDAHHGRPAAVVYLRHTSFAPADVTVHPGQSVEWVWDDGGNPNNVTFQDFASATKTAGTYFHTFDALGTFSYRCTLYQTMVGSVTVTIG